MDDGASIECTDKSVCAELDDRARDAARWQKKEPVWGVFAVEFYGRVGMTKREKQYLGDGTRTVIIERIISVRKRADP
ncbi:hypothetical protein [Sphingomonas sp. LT1P40]|uniref:hypothetical protein n=1 Tax=Alteristakelama amylovorans TaxID=3096166 RepID=UPI002FCACBE5